jgi:hypothetical protein
LERSVVERFCEEQAILVWHANGTVKMGREMKKRGELVLMVQGGCSG